MIMPIEWEKIKGDLLRSGGDFVLRPKHEPDLEKLLHDGKERSFKKIETLNGDDGSCHKVSARGWKQGKGSLVTGYALSEDGGWRQHSWMEQEGTLLEPSTRARRLYWGVKLEPSEAEAWSRRVLAGSIRWWQPVGVFLFILLIAGTIIWASHGAPLPFPEPEPLRI